MRRGLIACAALALLLASLLVPPAEQAVAPQAGARILDRHGRLLYQVVDPERGVTRPVRLADIAPSLRQATIAAEDASFASNPGLDPLAVARAAVQDLRVGDVVAGGSTITQQLARLRYLPPAERDAHTLARKLHEAWLAPQLTLWLGKDAILEQYLNAVAYGNLAIGAEAAAWTIFNKPARELSLAESALLAGLPQAPADYDPFAHPDAARTRQRHVLDLMVRDGFISAETAAGAQAEPLRLNPRPYPIQAPHFVDMLRDQLAGVLGQDQLERGGLHVWTTLDLDLQQAVERAVTRHLAAVGPEHDLTNAAVVALDPRTGEVLAMVGSADYFDPAISGQVNLALAPRQPGSAFKPIAYAAALESGRYSLASILNDERTVFTTRRGEVYIPENYDHRFRGPVSLRVALASSFNVPAVQVLSDVGLASVLELATNMGLTTLAADTGRYDLSLALGGGEVRLLDLTAAYTTFATGGVYRAPLAIQRVEDSQGRLVLNREPETGRRVLSPQTAWLISDILSDDAARTPGFGPHSALELDRPVAVKTGTTTDFRDNLTIGYTPQLAVGVWAGNADNHPMRDVSGVTGAAPLWHEVLTSALDGHPRIWLNRPDGLVEVELCAETPEPAGAECPNHRLDWLPVGLLSRLPTRELLPVRLVSPDPGASFVLDPWMPASAQKLSIEAEAPGAARVELFVDGQLLAALTSPPYQAGWSLTPGHHHVWAVSIDADGTRYATQPRQVEVSDRSGR
jgi:penicillin-binding protein 1C